MVDAGKVNTTITPKRAISTSISTVPTTTNLNDNPVEKEDGKPFDNNGVKENHNKLNHKHDSNNHTKKHSVDSNTKKHSVDSNTKKHSVDSNTKKHSKHHDSFFGGDTFFE